MSLNPLALLVFIGVPITVAVDFATAGCYQNPTKPLFSKMPVAQFDIAEVHGRLSVMTKSSSTSANKLRSQTDSVGVAQAQYIAFPWDSDSTCTYTGVDISAVRDETSDSLAELGSLQIDVSSSYLAGDRGWRHTQRLSREECHETRLGKSTASTQSTIADNLHLLPLDTIAEMGHSLSQLQQRLTEANLSSVGYSSWRSVRSKARAVRTVGGEVIAAQVLHGTCPQGHDRIPFLAEGDICTDIITGVPFQTVASLVHLSSDPTAVTLVAVSFAPTDELAATKIRDTGAYISYRLRATCLSQEVSNEQISDAMQDATEQASSLFNLPSTQAMDIVAPKPSFLDTMARYVTRRINTGSSQTAGIYAQRALLFQRPQSGTQSVSDGARSSEVDEGTSESLNQFQDSWMDPEDEFLSFFDWSTQAILALTLLLAVMLRTKGYPFVYLWLAFLYTAAIGKTVADGVQCVDSHDRLDYTCHAFVLIHYFGVVAGVVCISQFVSFALCSAPDFRHYELIPRVDDTAEEAQFRLQSAHRDLREHTWRHECCSTKCAHSHLKTGLHAAGTAGAETARGCVLEGVKCCCRPLYWVLALATYIFCLPCTLVALSMFVSFALQPNTYKTNDVEEPCRTGRTKSVRMLITDADHRPTEECANPTIGKPVADPAMLGLATGTVVALLMWQSGVTPLNIGIFTFSTVALVALSTTWLRSRKPGTSVFLARCAAAVVHAILLRSLAVTGWICPMALGVTVLTCYVCIDEINCDCSRCSPVSEPDKDPAVTAPIIQRCTVVVGRQV